MFTTRAAVVHEPGAPYRITPLRLMPPGAGEVLVRMAFAGICHSDESVRSGNRPHAMPCVPGHEGAGIVEAVGVGVSSVRPGDAAILCWQPSCRECFHCRAGQPYLCPTYPERITKGEARYFTGEGDPVFSYSHLGCFSERAVVRQECCIPIEGDFPLDVAALIGCAVTTGVGAVLNTAKVKKGESVAIFGLGGVGLCVLAGATYAGAGAIIAIDALPAKEALARTWGATHFLSAEGDVVAEIRRLTGERGADYAFEVVGHPEVSRQCFEAVRSGGTAVAIGLPRADSQFSLRGWELVGGEKKLVGSLYGSADAREFFPFLMNLHASGAFDFKRLISRVYQLEEINDGFAALRRGEHVRGIIAF